ncbi:MAG: TRAP transporter small permease [Marinomonas sp.]
MMDKISDWLVRLGAIGLVAMTVIVGWQVIGRFILAESPSWTEQAALILMIWYVIIAAAAGVHEGFHIRIALLEQFLPKTTRFSRMIISLTVIILGMLICIYGAQLVWAVRGHQIPSLGVSRSLAYAPLPGCGLLMAIFALRQFVSTYKNSADEGAK